MEKFQQIQLKSKLILAHCALSICAIKSTMYTFAKFLNSKIMFMCCGCILWDYITWMGTGMRHHTFMSNNSGCPQKLDFVPNNKLHIPQCTAPWARVRGKKGKNFKIVTRHKNSEILQTKVDNTILRVRSNWLETGLTWNYRIIYAWNFWKLFIIFSPSHFKKTLGYL